MTEEQTIEVGQRVILNEGTAGQYGYINKVWSQLPAGCVNIRLDNGDERTSVLHGTEDGRWQYPADQGKTIQSTFPTVFSRHVHGESAELSGDVVPIAEGFGRRIISMDWGVEEK